MNTSIKYSFCTYTARPKSLETLDVLLVWFSSTYFKKVTRLLSLIFKTSFVQKIYHTKDQCLLAKRRRASRIKIYGNPSTLRILTWVSFFRRVVVYPVTVLSADIRYWPKYRYLPIKKIENRPIEKGFCCCFLHVFPS